MAQRSFLPLQPYQIRLIWLLLTLATGVGAYLIYSRLSEPKFDGLLLSVIGKAGLTDSYSESSETDVTVGKRKLLITGVYTLDLHNNDFASESTTTLLKLDKSESSALGIFTVSNKSLGSDVYYKIDTASEELEYILKEGRGWHHYDATHIPPELTDVAVHGPILDDLAIFRFGTEFLVPIRSLKEEGAHKTYMFKLSKKSPPSTGPLHDLLSRIGSTGHIELTVDTKSSDIVSIHFSGKDYESTTTILSHMASTTFRPPLPAH